MGPRYVPSTLPNINQAGCGDTKRGRRTFDRVASKGEGMCSVIMSTNPTEGPKNWSSTTLSRGRTSILYMTGLSWMPKVASVSLSASDSSLSTWLYNLYNGSRMKCTNDRFASGSAGLRVNLRDSSLYQISPHNLSANALTSKEPDAGTHDQSLGSPKSCILGVATHRMYPHTSGQMNVE